MTFSQVGSTTGQRAAGEIVDGRVAMQAQADDAIICVGAVEQQPLIEGEPVAELKLSGDGHHARVELSAEELDELVDTLEAAREGLD